MGCTKSKVQDKAESTLSDETSEMISQYESIQKRRLSYPIEKIFSYHQLEKEEDLGVIRISIKIKYV